MSTSVIIRPLSPHSDMSSDSNSSNQSSTINQQSPPNSSTNCTNNVYLEQRGIFIKQMYNTHNSPQTASNKSLLSPSTTPNAASDSFILDANSPLFNRHIDKNKQNIPPLPPLYPKLFKPASINTYTMDQRKNDTESINKHKSFTVTPPSSPKSGLKARGKLKAHSFSSMGTEITAMLPIEDIKAEEIKRKQSNIDQKEDIIPPKKMKKVATEQELQLVIDHYDIAQDKDIEQILADNEPHVLKYRDKIYKQAKLNGITAKSDDMERLKILADVIKFAYMNIEPPNDYTKQTDRKHFKEVAAWSVKFAKNKGITAPLTLVYSAWCHDIERFIPATKCEYLPEAVDKYRKQIIHGVTSAKVATCLLEGAPVTKEEIERVHQLVLHHDIPHPREDIVILDKKLISGAREDIMWELELLMDADSFAFFQSTIYYFILFKSKKNSPDWIWERVKNNVKRLRPYLRPKAVECINKLPQDILSKMSINNEELTHLCSESSINSPIPSEISINSPIPTEMPSQIIYPNISTIKPSNDAENVNNINNNDEIHENMDFLSAQTIQQISDLKINESNDSNGTFDSEDCELVNIESSN